MDDDMMTVFRQEATDLIESLERGLLDLADQPEDRDLVNAVFRDLHTIKGSGAMFGFTDMAAFVHVFESAFDLLRSGQAAVTPEIIRLSLSARDEIIGFLGGQPDPEGRREAILAALGAAVAGVGGAASAPAAPAEVALVPVGGQRLHFRLLGNALALGARPDLLLNELRELGATDIRADLSQVPALDALDPEICTIGWSMCLPAGTSRDAIDGIFLFNEADIRLDPIEAEAPAAPVVVAEARPVSVPVPTAKKPVEDAPVTADRGGATMRVAAERLDHLMDRVGELVIADARLLQLAQQSRDPALMAAAEEISRLAAGLRDTTMRIRMVPVRSMIGRFRRLIHGLSETVAKPVNFVVRGEDTELDKTVIEQLADPIVHMLRNSMDHGLETPAERQAAGKPAEGQVTLEAEYSGAEVVIRIGDDGRGLNRDRIRAKAVANGVISADALLTDAAMNALILEPGFSTAEAITELSGRGVGMDVVKKTIEGLRGSIEVDSVEGRGTTFTLRLPLTLAIIEGLLVEVAGERFSIPLAAVQEIVELPPDKLEADGGADFLDVRDRLVPLVRLRRMFGSQGEPDAYQTVVIVRAGDTRAGAVVDRIIGTNQIVIKQMSRLHAGVRAFSGATILGDGTVALILDVPHLAGVGQGVDDRTRGAAA
ncbi:two-component system chemotaxis sensor kinase CheA [Cereibacter ovatus]|uniref:Chemotaxis protein CheA n=2 Tax=Cereibacter ovatus TaxID=439529 RepID=A0A285CTP5_9RHOB|nr:two-component system chemotaxis sensor kinase CheA [Cereibacter ovatus]